MEEEEGILKMMRWCEEIAKRDPYLLRWVRKFQIITVLVKTFPALLAAMESRVASHNSHLISELGALKGTREIFFILERNKNDRNRLWQ